MPSHNATTDRNATSPHSNTPPASPPTASGVALVGLVVFVALAAVQLLNVFNTGLVLNRARRSTPPFA